MKRNFKIIIVVIAVVIIVVLGYTYYSSTRVPQPESLELKARHFVDLLQNKKFDEAYDLFNDQMVNAITLGELETGWNELINQVGQYRNIIETRMETEMGYKVVYVTTEFEEVTVDIKVVFDSETNIAGLWFEF